MAPISDVIRAMTSSWSASSQKPGIQPGSGGVAYASGVSVTTALNSSTASARNRSFIAPCIYASRAGKSTACRVSVPEIRVGGPSSDGKLEPGLQEPWEHDVTECGDLRRRRPEGQRGHQIEVPHAELRHLHDPPRAIPRRPD